MGSRFSNSDQEVVTSLWPRIIVFAFSMSVFCFVALGNVAYSKRKMSSLPTSVSISSMGS